MQHFTKSIVALCITFLLLGATAHAGPMLTATHTIVSQQAATGGGTTVTLNITLNNPGTTTLGNVSLHMLDPIFMGNPNNNVIQVGTISAGAAISRRWSLTVPGPGLPPLPLMFDASATDASGAPMRFLLISRGR